MIRNKEESNRGIEIDLTGPEGNAYVLMGYAKQYATQLSYSKEKIEELMTDMRSSDYEHLIDVFDNHFGKFVTLWR